MYGFDLGPLFRIILILLGIAVASVAYIGYTSIRDYGGKTIKTTTHPTIDWELKSNGKRVDTTWIYKFK